MSVKKALPGPIFWGRTITAGDIFTRVVYGGRVSLQVSSLAVLLGTTVGAMWGVASAHIGGRFDMISQRVLEVFMAFPSLVLAMVLLVGIGAGLWTVIIAISVTRLPYGVRVVRSVAMSIKENRLCLGSPGNRSVQPANDVPPHSAQCIAPFLVLASAHLGVAINNRVLPGFPGGRDSAANLHLGKYAGRCRSQRPYTALATSGLSGSGHHIVVLGFNFFGDAVRDAFDPKLRGR